LRPPESFFGGLVSNVFVCVRSAMICFFVSAAGSLSSIAAVSASRSADSSSASSGSREASSAGVAVTESASASASSSVLAFAGRRAAFGSRRDGGAKPNIVGSYSSSGGCCRGAPVAMRTFSGITWNMSPGLRRYPGCRSLGDTISVWRLLQLKPA